MNAVILLAASAVVGVDFGWQPLNGGGVEYIIQMSPQQVDMLAKQRDIASDIPSGLDVRRFKITVGTDQLPRIDPTPSAPPLNSGVNAGYGSSNDSRDGTVMLAQTPTEPTLNPIGADPNFAPPPNRYGINQQVATEPEITDLAPPTALAPDPNNPPVQPPLANNPPLSAPQLGLEAPPTTPPLVAPPVAPALDPKAIADRHRAAVSRALDDPNAPGRAPGPDSGQPHPRAERRHAPRPVEVEPTPVDDQQYERRGPAQDPRYQDTRYAAQDGPAHHSEANKPAGDKADAPKPWPPLITAISLLLVSISANVYLAWVAWESRLRYRELLVDQNPAVA